MEVTDIFRYTGKQDKANSYRYPHLKWPENGFPQSSRNLLPDKGQPEVVPPVYQYQTTVKEEKGVGNQIQNGLFSGSKAPVEHIQTDMATLQKKVGSTQQPEGAKKQSAQRVSPDSWVVEEVPHYYVKDCDGHDNDDQPSNSFGNLQAEGVDTLNKELQPFHCLTLTHTYLPKTMAKAL